ncbi:uncharacterized protein RCC_10965 [Ramularia collo-cygni]|uniref:Ubiquitin-like protease family profile domain-containing protein n=1 Tax=Ramularia collo-cygni TaxID=112498 RepID=A0A2D3V735_9PEZI|nr:uncharacterized protein RCC_10965 [Ramularia collo-cygni]CZT25236.1 uncharacterized protein RCC_10965 [Ramularia collo-cygni]
MKRQRPSDLHEEPAPLPSPAAFSFSSYIPALLVSMWNALTSQTIDAVNTTPPTSSGNAPKRRAIAREDVDMMPGHFPTSSPAPEARPTPKLPVTPSPSPPRPGDATSQSQANASSHWRALIAWVTNQPQTKDAPAHEIAKEPEPECRPVNRSIAPPVSANDDYAQLLRSRAYDRNHMPIIERLERLRALEERGQQAPPELRQSYPTAILKRDSTPKKTSSPRADINNRRSFRQSQTGLRRSTNANRDSDVDGLIDRLKKVTHESAEDTKVRESWRLRERRLADEKGPTARVRERQEEERRVQEEERAQAEQKAQAELEAQQKEDARARKEQEALEAQQAAEDARKNLLIRPLDPKWSEIVRNAMNVTNAQKVFSQSPDGTDITRYVLGRILPQQNESQVSASVNGKGGPSNWLNDECVDNWVAMIVARRQEKEGYVKGPNSTPSIVSYLSAFWKTYNERGAKALSGWSRRKGISGKKLLGVEKIFFPVNTGNHWILLVIAPKSRTIEVFDSAGGSSSRFLKFARDWLAMELGGDYNPDEWQHSSAKSSIQQNWDDCGVFTCVNALASAKNKPPSAVVATNGMSDARNMMVAVLINGGFKEDWEL